MKKITSWIFVVIQLIICCSIEPVMAAEIPKNNTKQIPSGDIVLFSQDFSENTLGLANESLIERVKISDDNFAAKYKGTNEQTFGVSYEEVLPEGRYSFTYDFYSEDVECSSWIRIANQEDNGTFVHATAPITMRFNSGGARAIHRTSHYKADAELNSAWTPGWHSAGVWIDTKNREVAYWVDGECVSTMVLMDEISGVKGVGITHSGKNESFFVDNVKLCKDSDSESAGFFPIYPGYTTGEKIIGNNFFTDMPPEFNFNFINRTGVERKFEVYYKALNSNGVTVWESEKSEITLSANESVLKTVNVGREYFGRMTLQAVMSEGERTYIKEIPYTYSNRNTTQPTNKFSGVNTHMYQGRGVPEKTLPLMSYAGIGNVRDYYIRWNSIERQKGVYEFPKEFDDFLNLCVAYDVRYLMCGLGNPLYTKAGDPSHYAPVDEEGYKALERFCTALADWADGRIFGYEIWNEWINTSMTGWQAKRHDIFAAMHHAAWKGWRASSKGQDVWIMGLAEDHWSIKNGAIDSFLTEINKISTNQAFDSVATHPYSPGFAAPERGITGSSKEEAEVILEKFGYDPKLPRFLTEFGYNDFDLGGDVEKTAAYEVRTMAQVQSEDSGDVIYKYVFFDYPENASATSGREATFGITEGYDAYAHEVPYLGKPQYVAIAYYNNITLGYDYAKSYGTDDTFAHHFENADGSDLLMIGCIDETEHEFIIDLGCESVTVGDLYGNETEIFGSDGVYSFQMAENEVAYIRGSFDKVEFLKESENAFSYENKSLQMPISCEFELNVGVPQGFNGEIFAQYGGMTALVDKAQVKNSQATLKFKTFDEPADYGYIRLFATENEKVYYDTFISLEYVGSAQMIGRPNWRQINGRTDIWNFSFNVKNTRTDYDISGDVYVDQLGKRYIIPTIAPGETREVNIPITGALGINDLGRVSADVNLKTGDGFSFDFDEFVTFAKKADTTPKIDGEFSDGEWDFGFFDININSEDQLDYVTGGSGYAGVEDCSAVYSLKYDMDNLYVACEVTDDIYGTGNEVSSMWGDDSIQILIVFDPEVTEGTQYCIGMADGTRPAIYRHSQEANVAGQMGTASVGEYTDGEVAIKRVGNKTYYEASFPWDKIKYDGGSITEGQVIYMSFLVNDNDGAGRRFYMEYGIPNIGYGSSNPSNATRTYLLK